MSADVLPFRRPAKRSNPPRPTGRKGLAIVLRVQAGSVVMTADDVEVDLLPAQAVELAEDLRELAADAGADALDRLDGPLGLLGFVGGPEARARLALLGDAVARFDSGDRRASGAAAIVALVRQLTAEVRR